jgi:hypothetical protein
MKKIILIAAAVISAPQAFALDCSMDGCKVCGLVKELCTTGEDEWGYHAIICNNYISTDSYVVVSGAQDCPSGYGLAVSRPASSADAKGILKYTCE